MKKFIYFFAILIFVSCSISKPVNYSFEDSKNSLHPQFVVYHKTRTESQLYFQLATDNLLYSRKNLTIFFSDIIQFTDLTDTMEPEKLAKVINSYLSEMTTIAVKSGGTIDKFIGDAIMVFFGDPETEGEVQDALKCVEMAILMRQRVEELQKHWKKSH